MGMYRKGKNGPINIEYYRKYWRDELVDWWWRNLELFGIAIALLSIIIILVLFVF